MNNNTLQLLIDLQNAVSKDETRYHLTAVEMKRSGDSLIMNATDGHIAVTHRFGDDALLDLFQDNESFLIFPDQVKALKNVCDKYVGCKVVRDGDSLKFSNENQTVEIRKSDLKYPNLDQILNPSHECPIEISFDADLLMKLSKSLGKRKKQSVTIQLDALDILKPIKVYGNETFGVLMPMRGLALNEKNIKSIKAVSENESPN